MNRKALLPALLASLVLLGACATSPDDPYSNTKRNAAIGAGVGALAGFFVGDGELDEILGTAAVGAGVGAGVGLYMDKQQQALEQISRTNGFSISKPSTIWSPTSIPCTSTPTGSAP